jgi:hypothetical protein
MYQIPRNGPTRKTRDEQTSQFLLLLNNSDPQGIIKSASVSSLLCPNGLLLANPQAKVHDRRRLCLRP